MKHIEDYVTSIPNFPEEGILFRDITTVLNNPDGLKLAIDLLIESVVDEDFDVVIGPESRGFIFATPVAYELHKSLVMIRKKGKLPRETVSIDYELEYGKATLEIHKDDIKPGQKVVIVDDLIATGGTIKAMIELIESLGGEVVCISCLMELKGLKGREVLKGYNVKSVLAYDGK